MPFLESIFTHVGTAVANRPWLSIFASGLITLFIGGPGFFLVLETEARPEYQWVPSGAEALDHNEYVKEQWPGQQRFSTWIATCKQNDCNILDAQYVQRLNEVHTKILNIKLDGKVVKDSLSEYSAVSDDEWSEFDGFWSFDGSVPNTQAMCFKFGPTTCGDSSILDVFPSNQSFSTLTNAEAFSVYNDWIKQPSPPFELSSIASAGEGVALDSAGNVVSAKAYFGFYSLKQQTILISGGNVDPLGEAWEAEALCILGIKVPDFDGDCPGDDLLDFTARFSRSLGDEFGATVSADIPLLIGSFMGIIIYAGFMLSRRDHVYSMISFSFAVIAVVGLSYIGGVGLGAFFGVKNNNLANLVIFLLLGLGVDDAFVLTSEFRRHGLKHPEATPEECTIAAAKHGGVSILITSLTDAVAFLVGSITVLPALGWFCAFCGLGVVFCFVLQIFFLLPVLLINARREEANRFDFLCCFKSSHEHSYAEPSGCCVVCKCGPDKLPSWMETFGKWITTSPGRYITIALAVGVFAAGIVGMTRIYKDFKIEWFVPDDSYIQDFFSLNEEYFESGQPCSIYVKDIDYFAAQPELIALHTYMSTTKYVDQTQSITDWYYTFNKTGISATTASEFYTDIFQWYKTGGQEFQNQIKWTDPTCNIAANWTQCDPATGILATKYGMRLNLEYTNLGQDRYDTMTALRSAVGSIFVDYGGSSTAFPFDFTFMYWEEVGVIDTELYRNLGICAGVIIVIVCLLIPNFRVAPLVIVSIGFSIIEVIGFMYFWDVTISGVSTIYILVSVGLSVDYSAHIAHIFTISTGSAPERSVKALTRIGPSTFNAVASTLVAVVVLAGSNSYVFRIFFKALCLVVLLGGGNGLIFLPALLSQFGGSKDEEEEDSDEKHTPGFKEMTTF